MNRDLHNGNCQSMRGYTVNIATAPLSQICSTLNFSISVTMNYLILLSILVVCSQDSFPWVRLQDCLSPPQKVFPLSLARVTLSFRRHVWPFPRWRHLRFLSKKFSRVFLIMVSVTETPACCGTTRISKCYLDDIIKSIMFIPVR
jgi:hypothetical protein